MQTSLPFALLIICGCLSAGEAKFAAPPMVTKSGERTAISFALAAPADVEVAVLNANGEVARHLAAGVLGGEKPPPEPLKPGLAQSLAWDGKDDFGKSAACGPFKVRVRAGTGVKLGRLIGDDPYVFGSLQAMAADEEGKLYILGCGGNRNQDFRTLRVLDSDGRYLRTVMPFPASVEPDDMKDVARWDEERKAFHPRNLSSLNPEFYAFGHKDNLTLVSASARNGLVLSFNGRSLCRLDSRGGVPGNAFAQGIWGKESVINTGCGPTFLAASPDGKYLYLSGPFSSKTSGGHGYIPKWPPGGIYRMKLGGAETMQSFVTIPVAHPEVASYEAGKVSGHGAWMDGNYHNCGISEGPVHGVAVDAKGNVYVADREKQRVAVFDEHGKEIGEIKVAWPHQIAIHPKSGEIYVLSRHAPGYWRYQVRVLKFKGYEKGAAPTANYSFPIQGGGSALMALVNSERRSIVYVAGVVGNLVALEDKGTEFTPVETACKPAREAFDVYNRMEVDAGREEVYVSNGDAHFARFNGLTGEGGMLKQNGKPFHATDLAVGYDGLLYFQTGASFSGPLERYTRDLAPVPYPSGTNVLSKYIYGRFGIGNCEKGIGVGPDGKVYVSWMTGGWVKYGVSAWNPDGKPLNGKGSVVDPSNHKNGTPSELTRTLIGPIPQANGGVRVDLQGNIYVGMIAGAKTPPAPKNFEKNGAYLHCTGSVVKFAPDGGSVPGAPDMMTGNAIEGALHTYPGLAPFSHPHLGTGCCVCRVPRFGLDRYGRLAMPNAMGNFVLLVDNAGNEILSFGKYGNFDSQYVNPNTQEGKAGRPAVAVPDIPLAWPTSAGITDRHVYVLDVYNRRVVRTDLTYAAEAVVEVK